MLRRENFQTPNDVLLRAREDVPGSVSAGNVKGCGIDQVIDMMMLWPYTMTVVQGVLSSSSDFVSQRL